MGRSEEEEDDSNGIQVFLRIKPSDNPTTYFQQDDIDLNYLSVKIPKKNEDELINNSRSGYSFAFNSILDEKANQRDVFNTVGKPALRNALDGFNSTIFAYGQTGSGKTFTITGGPESYDDRGIIPRAIAHLFKAMKGEEQNGSSFSCYISYLEIYNQSGYDLLMENNQSSSSFDEVPKVTMLEDEDGHFHFKNLSLHMVSSEEDALNLLFLGDTNRAIAATEMNQNSTRSHCIFTIILEKRQAGADTVTRSKLNIVDLAGSERVGRTSSAGQTLREAKYINSSLFFLEMVIVALYEKEKKKKKGVHVPYRNSMMTSVLRDSLGGNCKTIMIAAISPEPQHTDESISTCHFAQRVALVKNSASVNEEVKPELVIQRLKAEVKRLREEVEFLSGKNDDDDDSSNGGDNQGNLPQDQMNELTESVELYVKDKDKSSHLDFGGITLPKIRAVCSIFKEMLLRRPRRDTTIDDDRGDIISSSDEESSEEDELHTTQPGVKPRDKRGDGKQQAKATQSQKSNVRTTEVNLVCGVPICTDKRVIDEPNAAYSWFKERYPGLSSMDKNKSSLKLRYSEAKNAGKGIEDIRSRIIEHKEAIEKFRKDHAISMISGHGQISDNDILPEEKVHTVAINREKSAYKETLEHLRGLKGTIESMQKLVETGRLKLQADFDKWYHQMCSNESQMRNSHPNQRQEGTRDASKSSNWQTQEDRTTQNVSRPSSVRNRKEITPPGHNTTTLKPVEPSDSATDKSEFKLPPGIQLTGNPEADADIIAFFKAKELLLSKTSRR